jgi:hypothetical protein
VFFIAIFFFPMSIFFQQSHDLVGDF